MHHGEGEIIIIILHIPTLLRRRSNMSVRSFSSIRAVCRCLCARRRQGPLANAVWSGQRQLEVRPRRLPQHSTARGAVVCSADAEILGAYAAMNDHPPAAAYPQSHPPPMFRVVHASSARASATVQKLRRATSSQRRRCRCHSSTSGSAGSWRLRSTQTQTGALCEVHLKAR